MVERASRRQVLVAPQQPLVAGGAAEEYERLVHDLFRTGCRHLIADLRGVDAIDSAGVRALVRSHTTAQRTGGTFTLVGPQPAVRDVLQLSRLESVFRVRESLAQARVPRWHGSDIRLALSGSALCLALWWAGVRWNVPPASTPVDPASLLAQHAASPSLSMVGDLARLLAAGLIGLLVTAVQRRFHDKPMTQAMEHAQVLLCVSGALVMMIIGESLARAFGIAGAATIIRFRTPIEDPKDITILFVLMALGMAMGLGALGIAAAGTAFVCLFLILLEHVGGGGRRTMMVEIAAAGREFPLAHVQRVFARNQIVFEPREVAQKKEVTMVYHTTLDPVVSLEDVSAQLMAGDAGVTAVSWEPPKRSG
jgi:anti-anti-sigma factor